MISTLRPASAHGKGCRLPNPGWTSPVANLPTWPALLGLLVTFSIIVVLTTSAIHHDGLYSPLNRSPRAQYIALHDEYLESARGFFSDSQGRNGDFIQSNESSSNQTRGGASFQIGNDVSRVATALVVMASKRRVPYVQIWTWSLLTGSSAADLNRTSVTIINTQKPSSANGEDLQPLRDAGIPVVDMYEGDGSDSRNRQWGDWILDEYLAHIEALRACDRPGIVWCIVFEEDSLLTRDFLGKFRNHVVEELPPSIDNVGMVKLFITDAWSGYQWPAWLQDLVLIPFCLAAALTVPFAYFLACMSSTFCDKRRRNASPLPTTASPPKSKRSILKLALCFATLLGNIVIVAGLMSRQSVIAMLDFPAIHMDRCTNPASNVALAFPIEITRKLREHLEGVVQSGRKARSFPIDLETWFWVESVGLTVLETSPSLAQHIGLFSSNPVKEHVMYLSQDSRFTFLAGENFFQRALSRFVPAW